jgi:hypothetical protein
MGCTQIQGYYLTRPIPVPEFPAWLAEYRRMRGAVPPGGEPSDPASQPGRASRNADVTSLRGARAAAARRS